jgi:hypothetical protein
VVSKQERKDENIFSVVKVSVMSGNMKIVL